MFTCDTCKDPFVEVMAVKPGCPTTSWGVGGTFVVLDRGEGARAWCRACWMKEFGVQRDV